MDGNVVEILLIEDNPEDAERAIRALKRHNLFGAEALNYLFTSNQVMPKLILLDLKMPKADGIEVLRKIKSHEEKKIIPIVVLTSSKEERDIVESYQLGVNAYVVKPVEFEKFVSAISAIGFFWLILNQGPLN